MCTARLFSQRVDLFTWTGSSPSTILGTRKLETLGYPIVKTACFCVPNTGVLRTDGRTNGHTDGYAVVYTAACKASFAARCKNKPQVVIVCRIGLVIWLQPAGMQACIKACRCAIARFSRWQIQRLLPLAVVVLYWLAVVSISSTGCKLQLSPTKPTICRSSLWLYSWWSIFVTWYIRGDHVVVIFIIR